MAKIKWHIGCSGFMYREWKNVFYPEKLVQRKWFEYYSTQFDTLELNVTFYKFPQLAALQKWYDVSPEHFSFSLKVPRLITHYRQLKDCKEYLDDFFDTVQEGLKEKLGCILFQLPPKFSYTPERLQLVIDATRPGINNAVEFRHESWWQEEVYNELKRHKISFVGVSHPKLPDAAIFNLNPAYYRFHGVPKMFYSEYDHGTLKRIADELLSNNGLKEVYIYFNNTAGTGAIENATWLREYVSPKIPARGIISTKKKTSS